MSQFDPGPIPTEVTPSYLRRLLLILADAINHIDASNIHPKGIAGDKLIQLGSTSLKRLTWTEWPIALVLPAATVATTSTTGTDYGPLLAWSPTKFPGMTWYLEATLAIANAAATATCELRTATAVVGSVSTQSTALIRVRSTALVMPSAQDLSVRVRTSDSAYAASFAGARLIGVPS